MAIDRVDAVAVAGICALSVASVALEGLAVAALLGGFLLSIALRRLYDGRPWEALGWLALVGAAVSLALEPGGPAALITFLGFMAAGIGLLFGGRFDLLADVWTVDRE